MSKKASLRCCGSCMWIYKGADRTCPQCQWASYGARYVFGDKAYRYAKTQRPWFEWQMAQRRQQLWQIIGESNDG